MSAPIRQNFEPEQQGVRLAMNVAGALLLATATLLLLGYLGNTRFAAPVDPLFQLSTRWVFGGLGGLCAGLAAACLFAKSTRLAAGLVLWLGFNVVIYVVGCHWTGNAAMGVYLMPLESTFGLPPGLGRWLLGALLVALLCAGLFPLLWPLLHRRLGLAEYLKMFCPACGGHIKFDRHDLGRTNPCPHCQVEVTLREQTSLKIFCYFCKGHIEFPPYALGRKIDCPHCRMNITLQLPDRAL